MKKIIYPTLIVFLLMQACKNETTEDVVKDNIAPTVDTCLHELSTYFEYEAIDEKEFEKYKNAAEEVSNGASNEKVAIERNPDLVKRDERSLRLKANQKSKDLIKSEYFMDVYEEDVDLSDVEIEPKTHMYLGTYKNISLIYVMYFEYYDYIFVDMEDLEQHTAWGFPRVSPDSTLIIACNSDLASGFTSNGVQLFTKKGGSWMKSWEKEMQLVGPEEIYWIDNESLVLKAAYWPVVNEPVSTRYYKLKLK